MSERYYNLKLFIKKYPRVIDVLLKSGEMVICRSKTTGTSKEMGFKNLYMNNKRFWQEEGATWDYFISKKSGADVLDLLKAQDTEKEVAASFLYAGGDEEKETNGGASSKLPSITAVTAVPEESPKAVDNFGDDYRKIDRLSMDEKVNLLKIRKEWLSQLAVSTEALSEEKLEALVETTKDGALVNKSVIDGAFQMDDETAKVYTSQVVANTHELIRAVSKLMSPDIIKDDLFTGLVEKSNGTVIQHMTRVFLTGFAFLHYYNDQALRLGVAQKLRIRFQKDYKKFYRNLCPHLHPDYITLEHVFMGGVKGLTENEMHEYAVGYLVHDVGKVDDIEYHEGEEAYNREKVVRHVKRGYQAIMNKTNYSASAGLITGYHHEYYNNKDGYGYFREFLEQYRKDNPKASLDYCMAFDMESIVDYRALAYFPAKVIEIVDIYDSLTDKNRKYRKPLPAEKALEFMRKTFLEDTAKIDPILFDMFCDYITQKPEKT